MEKHLLKKYALHLHKTVASDPGPTLLWPHPSALCYRSSIPSLMQPRRKKLLLTQACSYGFILGGAAVCISHPTELHTAKALFQARRYKRIRAHFSLSVPLMGWKLYCRHGRYKLGDSTALVLTCL